MACSSGILEDPIAGRQIVLQIRKALFAAFPVGRLVGYGICCIWYSSKE